MLHRISSLAVLSAMQGLAVGIQPAWVPGATEHAPTVVLVGGLTGAGNSSAAIEQARHVFEKKPREQRRFNLYVIPHANPEASSMSFPPAGTAYRENGPSHYLWRWLGLHAPDLVIVAGDQDFGLANALSKNRVAGVGSIQALRVPENTRDILHWIPDRIARSTAHEERDRRLRRTPREVAEELSAVYGHDFEQPVYIPAMALIGRLRLGQQREVVALVGPYADGARNSLANPTSSHLAGHLIFAELADRSGDQQYIERVRAAADLAFTQSGEMKEAMPMHSEMSDSVFMGCPILAASGKLTGKTVYFDMAIRHLKFMQSICVRADGLYRHSPLSDVAWGRGNAFPALGLSWTLLYIPQSHPGFEAALRSFQDHMRTLAKFQDRDGMWHQVIDEPGSYAEFSATAMIATAMIRGVSHGWLDRSYADRAQAAWRGILMRIGPGGELVDVCESTGKQRSMEDYFNRAASFGIDPRGGGMALLLATEWEAAPK